MPRTASRKAVKIERSVSTSSDIHVSSVSAAPVVEVQGGRLLIIRLGKELLSTIFNEGDEGRNARGTYAREYTLLHPEIQWVHRGQGRYLPAGDLKHAAALVPQRQSR